MKRLIFVLLLLITPLIVTAQVEELRAKLAENPMDVESLQALLKIYDDNYDFESYGTLLKDVVASIDEVPEPMFQVIKYGIERLLENYYSDYAEDVSGVFFELKPNKDSLLLYLKAMNSSWYLSEERVRESVDRLGEGQLETYIFLHEQSVELYPADLNLIVSRILVEDFGETDYLIPYIIGMIDDYDFYAARNLLNESSRLLEREPMFYYLNGILDLEKGFYDDAVEWFLQGKAYDDGTEIHEALALIYYIYVPDNVNALFRAIVLSDDETSLNANIQEFVANYPELSWIFSWVSRVPEPKRLTEILAEEVSVVSYTSVNFDFEKISIGFYDIEGVLQGTLVNSIYGQFLDASTYVYISENMDGVVVEGEKKARFDGVDVYSLSPDRTRFLLMDTWRETISMVDSVISVLWSMEADYGMIPVAWSPDGSRIAVSTGWDVFSIIDVESGEVQETIEDYHHFVFLSNEKTFVIDYEGNIVQLDTESVLNTDAPAFWAEFGEDGKIIYFEYPEDYADFLYDSLHVFDTVNGRDMVISDSTLFMDAPVPSVKIEGNLVYFTEKDQQGMHRIVVMNYITNEVLFVGLPSKDVIVFPDVRPE